MNRRFTNKLKIMSFCLAALLRAANAFAGGFEEDILKYTNQYRQEKGLAALKLDAALSRQAEQHSNDMAKGRTPFGHNGFQDRVNAVAKQKGRVSAAAENVAYGDMDAREVVEGWIRSKPHRKNLLGNYELIGIGVARKKDGTIYFTQLFIKP